MTFGMYVPRNSNREMQALRATTLSQLENQEKANKIVKTMGKKTKKDKETPAILLFTR